MSTSAQRRQHRFLPGTKFEARTPPGQRATRAGVAVTSRVGPLSRISRSPGCPRVADKCVGEPQTKTRRAPLKTGTPDGLGAGPAEDPAPWCCKNPAQGTFNRRNSAEALPGDWLAAGRRTACLIDAQATGSHGFEEGARRVRKKAPGGAPSGSNSRIGVARSGANRGGDSWGVDRGQKKGWWRSRLETSRNANRGRRGRAAPAAPQVAPYRERPGEKPSNIDVDSGCRCAVPPPRRAESPSEARPTSAR